MSDKAPRRRLAAILAADVVGFSRMMQADEAGTLAVLKSRRTDILQPLVSKHHGRIIKVMGDGVLVEFGSAVEAVSCAVALQEAMAVANEAAEESRRVVLRIGINLGDVMVEGGDLYGDGVNVAARLEGIADPGSVVVSETVFKHVRGRVKFRFDDLGEQQLKNIDEPVRTYRVRQDAGAATPGPALNLPDKPSIAVLPFENMSGDPTQDYVGDGIAENIITGLSRFRDLFVIARHSSFAYKGKVAKIPDVCRELGVRYVLEGSVQMSSGRVRVTVQFIDGTTNRHLWAERYDRTVEDIFAVQDEVTETIVGTLATSYGGRLRKAWSARADGSGQRNLRAIDYFQLGQDFLNRYTREDNLRARELFQKAADLDPGYAKPWAKMAFSHLYDRLFGWSEDAAASSASALKSATEAIRRDDDDAWGHWALGAYYLECLRQHDRALAELLRAVEMNPNDADVITDYGYFLSYAGRSHEGLEWALKGMRLNPHHPEWYVMQLGQIYYDARRYDEAIASFHSLSATDTVSIELYLAASYAALGHMGDSRKAIARALELDPEATIAKWTSPDSAPYSDPKDLEHFAGGLRMAGLPE
jgi:adenylate cyclase